MYFVFVRAEFNAPKPFVDVGSKASKIATSFFFTRLLSHVKIDLGFPPFYSLRINDDFGSSALTSLSLFFFYFASECHHSYWSIFFRKKAAILVLLRVWCTFASSYLKSLLKLTWWPSCRWQVHVRCVLFYLFFSRLLHFVFVEVNVAPCQLKIISFQLDYDDRFCTNFAYRNEELCDVAILRLC